MHSVRSLSQRVAQSARNNNHLHPARVVFTAEDIAPHKVRNACRRQLSLLILDMTIGVESNARIAQCDVSA